jgi:minor extracellular protease Epr
MVNEHPEMHPKNASEVGRPTVGPASPVGRWVITPNDNTFNSAMTTKSFRFLERLSSHAAARGHSFEEEVPGADDDPAVRVLDSIDLNESTLVEMSETEAAALKRQFPGLRIEPERWLHMLRFRLLSTLTAPPSSRLVNALPLRITVKDKDTGQPIEGAEVTVVFDREERSGVSGLRTNDQGEVAVSLPMDVKKIDLVHVSPHKRHWPVAAQDIPVKPQDLDVPMQAVSINTAFQCSLLQACSRAGENDGKGVRIAVIDGGVTPTSAMNFKKGLNTTGTEPVNQYQDNGLGHGTHVAGIVARLAPAAEIHAYRVFSEGAERASEFAIAKAVRQAVEDGCDLINLSLGLSVEPISIVREIRRARAFGTVCVAAAGNEYGPVSYPARSTHVIAVTAFGIDKAWPEGAAIDIDIAKTPEPIAPYFFAGFSNFGEHVDLTGPGVGVISDVSGTELGIMSGTSMASPAVAGLIARMLASKQDIYNMNRDQERSDEIIRLALQSAQPIGWGLDYEGQGFIRT